MPFAGSFSRVKTFTNGGTLLPADLNSIQDDYGNAIVNVHQEGAHNDGTTVRRGKSIIATEEARTNVAYGTLTTPDQVVSVVLPTDGLIGIAFSGMFKSSVNAAGSAAIFIGANQLKFDGGSDSSPVVQSAATAGTDSYRHLIAGMSGLATGIGVWTGPVTTGELVASGGFGGPCYVFAAAGTYTVSVQFKATSGSVTAKERRLWAWAQDLA